MVQNQTVRPLYINHPHAQTLYAYSGQYSDELSFPAGVTLTLVKRIDAEWWEGRVNGRTGLVPGNYIEVIEEPVTRDSQDTLQESVGPHLWCGCVLGSTFFPSSPTSSPPSSLSLPPSSPHSSPPPFSSLSLPHPLLHSPLSLSLISSPIPSFLHSQDEWSEDSDEEKGKLTYYFRGAPRTMEVDLGLLKDPSLLPLQWAIQWVP